MLRRVRANLVLFVSGFQSDNFIVGLTDVSPAITAPTLWNYDLCARYPGVVGEGATVNLPCTSWMPPRRYLIVQIPSLLGSSTSVRSKSTLVVS